jgi:hypothetical protein
LVRDGARAILSRAQAQGHLSGAGDPTGSWSLASLGFDDPDYVTLRSWYRGLDANQVAACLGKTQLGACHLPASRDPLLVEAQEAFGLVFLALSADTARRHDSVHNLWPFVANLACPPAVRSLLFTPIGQPTRDVKDALRAAAARFGLRRSESIGAQEYYQTVLLQIGLPEGSIASLSAFLSGTRALPDATRSLTDPIHGDPGFRHLWGALRRSRGASPSPTDLEAIRTSPWLRSTVVDAVLAVLRACPRAADSVDDSAPLGAAYFDGDLQLLATPRPFRPSFDMRGESVVDLFIGGKKRCRFMLQENQLRPTLDEAIALPPVSEVDVELRFRDGTPTSEARALALWDEEAAVVPVATDEPGTLVVLVESDRAPEVEPAAIPPQRFGERWAVRARGPCTIRVDGELVWASGKAKVEDLDVRVSLLRAFEPGSPGELLVDVAPPWTVTTVSFAGAALSLEPIDVHGTTVGATGRIQAGPESPTAIVRVVLKGPRGTRSVQRRVALSLGAWKRVAGSWERIRPGSEVELDSITGARRLRFSLPGNMGANQSLLAGDLTLGMIAAGAAPLPGRPLGYGEALIACEGSHGAAAETHAGHSICGAVVNRGRGGSLIERGGAWRLVIAQGLEYVDPKHRLLVWFEDGTLGAVPLAVSGEPFSEVTLPAAPRAAALYAGATRQVVAWTERWSDGMGPDDRGAHAALLAIRAIGVPFLADPYRASVRDLTRRYPALTARAWLARDPLFGASSRDLADFFGLFVESRAAWECIVC